MGETLSPSYSELMKSDCVKIRNQENMFVLIIFTVISGSLIGWKFLAMVER